MVPIILIMHSAAPFNSHSSHYWHWQIILFTVTKRNLPSFFPPNFRISIERHGFLILPSKAHVRTWDERSVVLLSVLSAGLSLELECLQLSHGGKGPVHPHHLSKCNTHTHEKVFSMRYPQQSHTLDVTRWRISSKTYHNDDCIEQKRDWVDQRYKHALGIKVLEIRKGPAIDNKDWDQHFVCYYFSTQTTQLLQHIW